MYNNCSDLSWEGSSRHTLLKCLSITAAEWVCGIWCRRPESTSLEPHHCGVSILNVDGNVHLVVHNSKFQRAAYYY